MTARYIRGMELSSDDPLDALALSEQLRAIAAAGLADVLESITINGNDEPLELLSKCELTLAEFEGRARFTREYL